MKKEEWLFTQIITPILPNIKFYWFKHGDTIPYLKEIANLEQVDEFPSGFNQKNADEMLLCFSNKELVGKIEFSQGGSYMDWILALHGWGYFIFSEFANRMRLRGISMITFKIVTNPLESEETMIKRMNFYQRIQCKYVNVGFNENTGATWFLCQYKTIYEDNE
jgi:hypothetical protein